MTEQPLITSRYNARVKQAVKLRARKGRDQQCRFLIDGVRELRQALAADVDIDEAFVCAAWCADAVASEALDSLRTRQVIVRPVTVEVFERLAFGDRREGVVAVARTPHRALTDIQLPPKPLVAVLEGVEKPGNLGAIVRSADAAGVAAVVVVGGGTDLYNPATIRASLGTIFHVPVCAASAAATLAWLAERKLPVFAARPDARHLYTDVDFRGGAAVVLGSEADGLTRHWHHAPCQGIRLPQRGVADSLNVAATAAVIFYEALRQRAVPASRGSRVKSREPTESSE